MGSPPENTPRTSARLVLRVLRVCITALESRESFPRGTLMLFDPNIRHDSDDEDANEEETPPRRRLIDRYLVSDDLAALYQAFFGLLATATPLAAALGVTPDPPIPRVGVSVTSPTHAAAKSSGPLPPEIMSLVVKKLHDPLRGTIASTLNSFMRFSFDSVLAKPATGGLPDLQRDIAQAALIDRTWHAVASEYLYRTPVLSGSRQFREFMAAMKGDDYRDRVGQVVVQDSWDIKDADCFSLLRVADREVPRGARPGKSMANVFGVVYTGAASDHDDDDVDDENGRSVFPVQHALPAPVLTVMELVHKFPRMDSVHVFHRDERGAAEEKFAFIKDLKDVRDDQDGNATDSTGHLDGRSPTDIWAINNVSQNFFGRYFFELKSLVREVVDPLFPGCDGTRFFPVLFRAMQLEKGDSDAGALSMTSAFLVDELGMRKLGILKPLVHAFTRVVLYELEWMTLLIQNAFDQYGVLFYRLMRWTDFSSNQATAADLAALRGDELAEAVRKAEGDDGVFSGLMRVAYLMLGGTVCACEQVAVLLSAKITGSDEFITAMLSIRGGSVTRDRLERITAEFAEIDSLLAEKESKPLSDRNAFLLQFLYRLHEWQSAGGTQMAWIKRLLRAETDKLSDLRKLRLQLNK